MSDENECGCDKCLTARMRAGSPPAPASELPSGPGFWLRDGTPYMVVRRPSGQLVAHRPGETGVGYLFILEGGNWLPLHDASEVERLRKRATELELALHRVESALEAAERERDEWKRQHDRVLSQARKDFDRAAMADTYERWLLDLGGISGCGHVDERLPRCIEEAFAKEQERATAAEQRLAEISAWQEGVGLDGWKAAVAHAEAVEGRLAEVEGENKRLKDLVGHCWVHSGYRDCGYDHMDSNMRKLYDEVKSLPDEEKTNAPQA